MDHEQLDDGLFDMLVNKDHVIKVSNIEPAIVAILLIIDGNPDVKRGFAGKRYPWDDLVVGQLNFETF